MNNKTNESANVFVYDGAISGSPAEKSDLRIGDQILSLNGVTLLNIEDLNKALNINRYKRVIEVLRGNSIINIEIDFENKDWNFIC